MSKKSKGFSLWGLGSKAEDKPEETEDEKATREKSEKEAAEKKAAAEAEAAAAKKKDDEEEEDEEEDDEATKAAVAAVPANTRRAIVRAERARIHGIVNGAGRDRVAQALHVALNTNMKVDNALAFVETMSPAAAGGRIGLQDAMGSRRSPALGADTRGPGPGKADEVGTLADGSLAFADRPNRDAA